MKCANTGQILLMYPVNPILPSLKKYTSSFYRPYSLRHNSSSSHLLGRYNTLVAVAVAGILDWRR